MAVNGDALTSTLGEPAAVAASVVECRRDDSAAGSSIKNVEDSVEQI